MRIFIAINFNDQTKQKLQDTAAALKRFMQKGTLTRTENLHLTLAFLGEVPEDRVYDVCRAIDAVRCPSFELDFCELGRFQRGAESLYWLGAAENQKLLETQRALIGQLRKRGFQPDEKPFRPHITLARRVIMDGEFHINDFHKQLPRICQQVAGISLMKSERKQGTVCYTELYFRKHD